MKGGRRRVTLQLGVFVSEERKISADQKQMEQAFVNQLAQRNITAFAWTSEAGQEIARLQAGR